MKTSQSVASANTLTEPRLRSASLLRASARASSSSGTAPKTEKATPSAPSPGVSASASAPVKQKRVRLKPESRDQLLERLRNPQLSLHEASILLRVSRATVRRYADAGRLQCLRTPGGQRRFYLRDIELFYRQLKMRR